MGPEIAIAFKTPEVSNAGVRFASLETRKSIMHGFVFYFSHFKNDIINRVIT